VQRATGAIVAEGHNRSSESPTFHGEIVVINRCATDYPFIDWAECVSSPLLSWVKESTIRPMDEWMTVPEAARRLGVSRQWIYKLCVDGRIEGARQIGRQWQIPEGAKINEPPARPRRPPTEIPRRAGKPRRKG